MEYEIPGPKISIILYAGYEYNSKQIDEVTLTTPKITIDIPNRFLEILKLLSNGGIEIFVGSQQIILTKTILKKQGMI